MSRGYGTSMLVVESEEPILDLKPKRLEVVNEVIR